MSHTLHLHMKKIVLISSVFLLCSFSFYTAQKNSFLDFLLNKIELFNKEAQREFIYLMLDKPIYYSEDNIWFAAWITEGNHLYSTDISQQLYVDLISPSGIVVKTLTLPISEGRSNGDFSLDKHFGTGTFTIKAYTRYSKSFGEQNVFEKKIKVQRVVAPCQLMNLSFRKQKYLAGETVVADFELKNIKNKPVTSQACTFSIYLKGVLMRKGNAKTDKNGKVEITFQLPETLDSPNGLLNIELNQSDEKKSISQPIPIVLNRINLSFHPEGGQIRTNVPNRIAFKALNEFGKPVNFEAVLLDHNNKTIKNFRSFYQGYGAFSFTPNQEKMYKIKITKPKGVKQEYSLPKALANVYSLQIKSNTKGKLLIKLNSPKNDSVYIVGSVRDKIYYSKKTALTDTQNNLEINTKKWPAGIARISIFDRNRNIVAERLVYTGSRTPMRISIEADKDAYSPNETVELKIRTKTEKNEPISAKLALSVVDSKFVNTANDHQDNILSYLLMSNELQEAIENPIFYFNADKKKAWAALDYVLMCSNLQRYSWLEIINKNPVVRIFPEQYNVLHGQVIDTNTGKGIKAKVWVRRLASRTLKKTDQATHLTTTDNGFFTVLNVNPQDNIALHTKFNESRSIDIKVNQEYLVRKPNFISYLRKTFHIAESKHGTDVKNVNWETTEIAHPEKELYNSKIEQKTGTLNDNSVNSYSLYCKYGKHSGDPNHHNQHVCTDHAWGQVLDGGENISLGGKTSIVAGLPFFLVDTIPSPTWNSSGYNMPEWTPPLFITSQFISESSTVLSPLAHIYYGPISYETEQNLKKHYHKKTNIESPFFTKYIRQKSPSNIFSPRKRFDASWENREKNRANHRTTFFWEPYVQTDNKGEAIITFQNYNKISPFIIIVEGISSTGQVGRAETELN